MENTHAITKQEMIEVLDMYFVPMYQMLGALLAIVVIGLAIALVIRPLIRRV